MGGPGLVVAPTLKDFHAVSVVIKFTETLLLTITAAIYIFGCGLLSNYSTNRSSLLSECLLALFT